MRSVASGILAAMGQATLTPDAVSAIAGAVGKGSSVLGTVHNMVQGIERTVVCGVEISNSTRYFLKTEGYYTIWGYVDIPPVSVSPGLKEAFVGYKNSLTTTGTTGVAVWKVGDTNTRLLVMWSIPWNHNHHSNVLALGFQEGRVHLDNETYYEMYYDCEPWFCRRSFVNATHCTPVDIMHVKRSCRVQGSMGTTHKTQAMVNFLPLVEDAVAPNLKNVLSRDIRGGSRMALSIPGYRVSRFAPLRSAPRTNFMLGVAGGLIIMVMITALFVQLNTG